MWFSSLSVYFCLKIVGLVIYGEETMDYGGKPLAGYRTQGSELLMILSNLFTFWGLNFLICKFQTNSNSCLILGSFNDQMNTNAFSRW